MRVRGLKTTRCRFETWKTEGQPGAGTGGRDFPEPARGAEPSQHQRPRTAVCGLG